MTPRGWCPSLHEPMQAGDGWLVRVKPSCGILQASEARVLAEASRRLGNGMIGLTNRGNLQFRGLTPNSAVDFADVVVALGLGAADPLAERRRNVLAAPLADAGARDLARALEAMLVGDKTLSALPAKFAITVDGGAFSVLAAPADMRWRLANGRAHVSLDGSDLEADCDPTEVVALTRGLIGAFLDANAHRMRDLDARARFAVCGLAVQPAALASIPPTVGPHPSAFGVGLPFGALAADTLDQLAGIAETRADATLHLTPFRSLLLPGAAVLDATDDLITNPDDPMLRIDACTGAPACAQATVHTRRDAAWLASRIQVPLHVSGCAKGCAHPGPSAFTLVGNAGRYDLVRHGRADGEPVETGLALTDIPARLIA